MKQSNGGVIGVGLAIMAVGLGFLLIELGMLDLSLEYTGPVALMLIGAFIVLRGFGAGPTGRKVDDPGDGSYGSFRPRRYVPPNRPPS